MLSSLRKLLQSNGGYIGVGVVVTASHFLLLNMFAVSTPYWDDWFGTAKPVIMPFLDGTLTLRALFTPHFQHTIPLSKFLALCLFVINRQWDPILEMTASAMVAGVTASLVCRLVLRGGAQTNAFIFCAGLLAAPVNWENTLWGFQLGFRILLLLPLVIFSLLFTEKSPSWSRALVIILLTLVSSFHMSSGFLGPLVGVFTYVVFCVVNRRLHASTLFLVAGCLLAIALGVAFRPSVGGGMTASSLRAFFAALARVSSYPMYSVFGGAWVHLPVVFGALALFTRRKLSNVDSGIVAVVLWCAAQMLAIAYARAIAPLESRYTDIFALLLVVDLALVARCLTWDTKYLRAGAYAWLIVVGGFLASRVEFALGTEIPGKKNTQAVETETIRKYLSERDPKILRDAPYLFSPAPDPEPLLYLFADSRFMSALPPSIRPPVRVRWGETCALPGHFYPLLQSPSAVGTFSVAPCNVRSSTFSMSLPFARMHYGGHPKRGIEQIEIESESFSVSVVPSMPPNESWQELLVWVPAGPLKLHLQHDDPSLWLAFDDPVEVGVLSGLAWWMRKFWSILAVLGLCLIAGRRTAVSPA